MIVTPVRELKKRQPASVIQYSPPTEELVAFCPACKAIQTVWFTGDNMMPTRKFHQEDGRVYHDCGSALPCRIYKS